MRVRCNTIIQPATGKQVDSHPSLHIGSTYLALELSIDLRQRVHLRVIDDSGTPSLWDARMFSTVDEQMPGQWGLEIATDGWIRLAPRPFLRVGFWEDYFNDEPAALATFEEQIQILSNSQQERTET